MKLILTAAVENLGEPGDIVEVKDGYGRNLLLPRGLAIVASRGAEKQIEDIKRVQQERQVRDLDHAKELRDQLDKLEGVTVKVRTAENGKLFGSVKPADIAEAVSLLAVRHWTSAASTCRRALLPLPAATRSRSVSTMTWRAR